MLNWAQYKNRIHNFLTKKLNEIDTKTPVIIWCLKTQMQRQRDTGYTNEKKRYYTNEAEALKELSKCSTDYKKLTREIAVINNEGLICEIEVEARIRLIPVKITGTVNEEIKNAQEMAQQKTKQNSLLREKQSIQRQIAELKKRLSLFSSTA